MQPYMNTNYYSPMAVPQIAGKIVNDFREIAVSDIPLNGQPAIFIKPDMSEINVRKWESNGMISNLTFKPFFNTEMDKLPSVNEKAVNEPFKAILEGIQSDIKTLTERVDGLAKGKGKKDD